MSVQFESLTLSVPPIERRTAPRIRFGVLMPTLLGRGDALVLDISSGGARVMHFAGLPIDSQVRLVFAYGGRRFSTTAQVLASRVVGLGNGPGGTTSYESRLRFTACAEGMVETLDAIVEQIERERLRTWVSNAAGDETPPDHDPKSHYFLRCRLRGSRWTRCWTRDPAQPGDGFTIPARLSDGEVALLCDAYGRADADNRELIRTTASMAA